MRIARLGPRPAASARERSVHRIALRAFARAGLRTEIQRFTVPDRGRSRNAIGIYDSPRRCLRVVMAHADSTPAGPGANDNASGVGVVTALAARLRRARPGCDVWLVATGSEERVYTGSPDHLGALALARRLRARGLRPRVRWALSLDEVGRGTSFWLRSPVSGPRRGVEVAIVRAGRATRTHVEWVRDEGSGNSDHREFELLGMPGAKLGVGAAGEPCRHTACDRASRLRPGSLRRARRAVERALSRR
ncbi:MAG: M28 family peptidase [Actinomycetota bacterium]